MTYEEITQEEIARLQAITFGRDEYNKLTVLEPFDGHQILSDVISNLLVDHYGFCGCACPDDAIEFFFVQLAGLGEGKNYFYLNGGLELFKLGCYELGLLDVNQKLTTAGELLANLGKKITDTELSTPETIFGHKLNFRDEKLTNTVFAILTDRTENAVPEWIDRNPLIETLHYFLYGLDRTTANSEEEEMVLYTYRGQHPGECTLLLYWLESILELEEHGSSTPGWIDYGSEFKWEHLKDSVDGFIKFTQNLPMSENPGSRLGPDLDWDIVKGKPIYVAYKKL